MAKCNEIRVIVVPSQQLEGRGKNREAALEDLYHKMDAKCKEKREILGKPCSEGTGCKDEEKCTDVGSLAGGTFSTGEDPTKPEGERHYAKYEGDIKCGCECKKTPESKKIGFRGWIEIQTGGEERSVEVFKSLRG